MLIILTILTAIWAFLLGVNSGWLYVVKDALKHNKFTCHLCHFLLSFLNYSIFMFMSIIMFNILNNSFY